MTRPLTMSLDEMVQPWYDLGMKTAISIQDELFAAADKLAARLGMSRSELYARAVAEFVAKHQSAAITKRLNAVYEAQPSELDPIYRQAQKRAIRGGEW